MIEGERSDPPAEQWVPASQLISRVFDRMGVDPAMRIKFDDGREVVLGTLVGEVAHALVSTPPIVRARVETPPELPTVRLVTSEGLVAVVPIFPFVKMPGVIVWGERVFAFDRNRDHGGREPEPEYREAFAWACPFAAKR